jgi:hypothetical protein
MRLIVLIVATLAGGGLALAESWREYSYPDQFFAVAFPGDPQMETTTYEVADNRAVEAQVYSVRQENALRNSPIPAWGRARSSTMRSRRRPKAAR